MPLSKAPKPVEPPPAVIRPQRFTPRKRGGAWKVAYADFVTALMALFIVLWMMNSSNAVKQSITGYFHDPKGYKRTVGAGPANAGEGLALNAANMASDPRAHRRGDAADARLPNACATMSSSP